MAEGAWWYLVGGGLIGFASAPILIILVLRFVAKRVLGGRNGQKLTRPPLPLADPPEADFTRVFRSLSDQEMPLESLRGSVFVLNFWATWCPSCVLELKELLQLSEEAGAKGIRLLCVSNETAEEVQSFLEKRPDLQKLPIYLRTGDLPAVYSDEGIPFTCIVSPQGRVVFSHCGAADWAHPDVLNYLLSLQGVAPQKSSPTTEVDCNGGICRVS